MTAPGEKRPRGDECSSPSARVKRPKTSTTTRGDADMPDAPVARDPSPADTPCTALTRGVFAVIPLDILHLVFKWLSTADLAIVASASPAFSESARKIHRKRLKLEAKILAWCPQIPYDLTDQVAPRLPRDLSLSGVLVGLPRAVLSSAHKTKQLSPLAAACAFAKAGDIDTLRYMSGSLRYKDVVSSREVFFAAGRGGKIDLLNWLCKRKDVAKQRFPIRNDFIAVGVNSADPPLMISWMWRQGIKIYRQAGKKHKTKKFIREVARVACVGGSVKGLMAMSISTYDHRDGVMNECVPLAAKCNQREILAYVADHWPNFHVFTNEVFAAAVEAGHHDLVYFLLDLHFVNVCFGASGAVTAYILSGDLDRAEALLGHSRVVRDFSTIRKVVESGRCDLVQWCIDRNYHAGISLLGVAISKSTIEVADLIYRHTMGTELTEVLPSCWTAAFNSDDPLQWFPWLQERSPMSHRVCNDVWFRQRARGFATPAMRAWFYDNLPEFAADLFGHLQ